MNFPDHEKIVNSLTYTIMCFSDKNWSETLGLIIDDLSLIFQQDWMLTNSVCEDLFTFLPGGTQGSESSYSIEQMTLGGPAPNPGHRGILKNKETMWFLDRVAGKDSNSYTCKRKAMSITWKTFIDYLKFIKEDTDKTAWRKDRFADDTTAKILFRDTEIIRDSLKDESWSGLPMFNEELDDQSYARLVEQDKEEEEEEEEEEDKEEDGEEELNPGLNSGLNPGLKQELSFLTEQMDFMCIEMESTTKKMLSMKNRMDYLAKKME